MNTRALERFVQLAARGARPSATPGEKTLNRLAHAFADIGNDMAKVDFEAAQGACEMLRGMGGPWPTGADKEEFFDNLNHAATGERRAE